MLWLAWSIEAGDQLNEYQKGNVIQKLLYDFKDFWLIKGKFCSGKNFLSWEPLSKCDSLLLNEAGDVVAGL